MNDKFLSFLGIAKRAGSLIFGMDEVKSKLLKGDVNLVVIASDISENSEEKIRVFMENNSCEDKLVKIDFTKEDMEPIIGKYVAVMGVSDINIAKKIRILAGEKFERNDAYNDQI